MAASFSKAVSEFLTEALLLEGDASDLMVSALSHSCITTPEDWEYIFYEVISREDWNAIIQKARNDETARLGTNLLPSLIRSFLLAVLETDDDISVSLKAKCPTCNTAFENALSLYSQVSVAVQDGQGKNVADGQGLVGSALSAAKGAALLLHSGYLGIFGLSVTGATPNTPIRAIWPTPDRKRITIEARTLPETRQNTVHPSVSHLSRRLEIKIELVNELAQELRSRDIEIIFTARLPEERFAWVTKRRVLIKVNSANDYTVPLAWTDLNEIDDTNLDAKYEAQTILRQMIDNATIYVSERSPDQLEDTIRDESLGSEQWLDARKDIIDE